MINNTDRKINTSSSGSAASIYQQLRSHLAVLRLHIAAERLPAVRDAATADGLTRTAALEQLLRLEVNATGAVGSQAGSGSPACPPWTGSATTPPRAPTST